MDEEAQAAALRLVRRLKDGYTITIAESCTGGLLASTITDIAGASKWFNQSWVTYSYDAKIRELNVDPKTLEKRGAVSAEVAIQMAQERVPEPMQILQFQLQVLLDQAMMERTKKSVTSMLELHPVHGRFQKRHKLEGVVKKTKKDLSASLSSPPFDIGIRQWKRLNKISKMKSNNEKSKRESKRLKKLPESTCSGRRRIRRMAITIMVG